MQVLHRYAHTGRLRLTAAEELESEGSRLHRRSEQSIFEKYRRPQSVLNRHTTETASRLAGRVTRSKLGSNATGDKSRVLLVADASDVSTVSTGSVHVDIAEPSRTKGGRRGSKSTRRGSNSTRRSTSNSGQSHSIASIGSSSNIKRVESKESALRNDLFREMQMEREALLAELKTLGEDTLSTFGDVDRANSFSVMEDVPPTAPMPPKAPVPKPINKFGFKKKWQNARSNNGPRRPPPVTEMLPFGWIYKNLPNGKTVFINIQNKSTTWDRPLPGGWVRTMVNGSELYKHLPTQWTQKVHPGPPLA